MNPLLGRADLLRALLRDDKTEAEAAAAVLGFTRQVTAQPIAEPSPATSSTLPGEGSSEQLTMRVDWSGPRTEQPLPLPEVELGGGDFVVPEAHQRVTSKRPVPLSRWSQLWPRLMRALASFAPSKDIDDAQLVLRISRGEALFRLPRRRRTVWPSHLRILVDRSYRLRPFYADQKAVCVALQRALGSSAVSVRLLLDGPQSRARLPGGEPAPTGPRTADPQLVLGDLGAYGHAADRRAWLLHAQQLRRRGVSLAALCLAPVSRVPALLANAWNSQSWEVEGGIQPGVDAPVEHLLRVLSFALRIEPGLLREVRRLDPFLYGDVASEADFWNHALVGGHSVACAIDREAAECYRSELASLQRDRLQKVAHLVREWHADAPQEIAHEETLTLKAEVPDLNTDEAGNATRFFTRLNRLAAHRGQDADWRREFSDWFARMAHRVPKSLWEDRQVGPVLNHLWRVEFPDARFEPPSGDLDPALFPVEGPARNFTIERTAQGLRFVEERTTETAQTCQTCQTCQTPNPVPDGGSATAAKWHASEGAALARLSAVQPVALLDDGSRRRSCALRHGHEVHTANGRRTLTVLSDRSRVVLRAMPAPRWASEVGRDRYGYWAAFSHAGQQVKLRWIPGGVFVMGSPVSESGRWGNEGPQHPVRLTSGYYLCATETTQALWETVMDTNPSRFRHPQRPVERVSWSDCLTFLRRLTTQVPGLSARLPTEAEWEYACRAGSEHSRHGTLDHSAWYNHNSGDETQAVAQKTPNDWGLYDMLGNVWEWCADGRRAYDTGLQTDPSGPTSPGQVLRGGSWLDGARTLRAATRRFYEAGDRFASVGLRIAVSDESDAT